MPVRVVYVPYNPPVLASAMALALASAILAIGAAFPGAPLWVRAVMILLGSLTIMASAWNLTRGRAIARRLRELAEHVRAEDRRLLLPEPLTLRPGVLEITAYRSVEYVGGTPRHGRRELVVFEERGQPFETSELELSEAVPASVPGYAHCRVPGFSIEDPRYKGLGGKSLVLVVRRLRCSVDVSRRELTASTP